MISVSYQIQGNKGFLLSFILKYCYLKLPDWDVWFIWSLFFVWCEVRVWIYLLQLDIFLEKAIIFFFFQLSCLINGYFSCKLCFCILLHFDFQIPILFLFLYLLLSLQDIQIAAGYIYKYIYIYIYESWSHSTFTSLFEAVLIFIILLAIAIIPSGIISTSMGVRYFCLHDFTTHHIADWTSLTTVANMFKHCKL